MEVTLHEFLTLVQDKVEWYASHSSHFIFKETVHSVHIIRGWEDITSNVHAAVMRKILSLPRTEPSSSSQKSATL
jgi:hypothetical protein